MIDLTALPPPDWAYFYYPERRFEVADFPKFLWIWNLDTGKGEAICNDRKKPYTLYTERNAIKILGGLHNA